MSEDDEMMAPKFAALHAGLLERPSRREIDPSAAVFAQQSTPIVTQIVNPKVSQLPPLPQAPTEAKEKRKALTLRLDPVLHLQLRLTAAQMDRSMQSILVDALHLYLTEYASDGVLHGVYQGRR